MEKMIIIKTIYQKYLFIVKINLIKYFFLKIKKIKKKTSIEDLYKVIPLDECIEEIRQIEY